MNLTNIYTIGFAEWYDQWMIDQGDDFKKKGRDQNYKGGSAFICFGQARNYLKAIDKPGYKLYKLDTTIDNLYQIGGNYHIVDHCRILSL